MSTLTKLSEPNIYNELHEFREETLALNESHLRVENGDIFELYASDIKFVAGMHTKRSENIRELREKYNDDRAQSYSSLNKNNSQLKESEIL